MDMLKIVNKLNNFSYRDACAVHDCLPFLIDGNQLGIILPTVLQELVKYPDVFVLKEETIGSKILNTLTFQPDLKTVEDRDAAVETLLEDLRTNKKFKCLKGWRNEKFSIYTDRTKPPVLHMERSACCLFGVLEYGVHINGYTYQDGKLKMWIGRRSMTKQLYPGLLDQMCAGGLSKGLGIRECAIKECEEEASVDTKTLEHLKSVGALSYCFQDDLGIHAETEYVFDLEVSPDFVPRNADGEMDKFYLYDIDKLLQLIQTDDFKPNCALVVLDFMMRHGIITHDSEPCYLTILEQMHTPLQPPV